MSESGPFTAIGVVSSIHDGDTLTADLDLGWHVNLTERPIRLAHIDAPELAAPGGRDAGAYLAQLAPPGTTIRVESLTRPDKYGRVLAVITLPDGSTANQRMLDAGHATPYDGGPKP